MAGLESSRRSYICQRGYFWQSTFTHHQIVNYGKNDSSTLLDNSAHVSSGIKHIL